MEELLAHYLSNMDTLFPEGGDVQRRAEQMLRNFVEDYCMYDDEEE